MKVFLRLLLVVFFLSSGFTALATKLYWVGGSGNFNDPAHWSAESGGQGGLKTPSASDDVYFDENSFSSTAVIKFVGTADVHDFIFSKYTSKVIFSGLANETLVVRGDFQLNAYVTNQFAGDIHFASSENVTNVFFSLATCAGNVYFDGNSNWGVQGNIITDDNHSVYLKNGSFSLNGAGIYTGNFVASPGVVINTAGTVLKATNNFVLPNGVTFNSAGSTRIYSYPNDPSKFQVGAGVNVNSNARIINNSLQSTCNVTNTSNTNPTCSGACDGTMSFNIPVGCSSNPVYAVWNTGSGCTVIPTGTLTPGTTYTVGNICGCGTQYSVVFTNDPNTQDSTFAQFNISIADPIAAKVNNFILKQPTCFGKCDGKVIAVLNTFGQLPISIAWTSSTFTGTVTHSINSHTKDTMYNACAGTYTVVLTDANGCTSAPATVTLTQPTKVTHTHTITNLLCNNICNGSVQETVSGGTPGAGYSYTWTPAGGTVTSTTNTSTYSNLCAGTYTFLTADANNCKDTDIVTVTQPPPITFVKTPASGSLAILCNNTCNGSVGVTSVSGGTGGYLFTWAPAGGTVSSTANSSTYSGLCGSPAGTTYTCTIKDANSCTVTATFTVTSPPALSNTITATQPKCVAGQGSSVGSATVTESGGASPYTFTWTPAGGTQGGLSPTSTYGNMAPGTYTVNIQDANLCLDTATVTITAPTAVSGNITTITNPTCPNLNNGQLCVTASGGTPGYTYTWSPAGGNANCTPSTLTVSPGGTATYTVIVSDVKTCTVAVTATLTSPPQATVSAAVTNPPCAGVCNGSATLTPTGGTGPFTYQWSCSGTTLPNISGQCGGTTCNYTVTDAGTNCKYTGSVSFTVAPTLTLSLASTALTCNYSCNSTITSTVSGGTPGYTYSWSGSGVCGACPSQVNMCAGTYTAQVTDNLGCVITKTVAVSGPAALSNTVTVKNPKCTAGQGVSVGSATVTASGGTAGYTFVWSPTVTLGACASPKTCGSNMPVGTYTVFITDVNNCLDTATVTLNPPTPVSGTITTTTNPTCPNLNNGQLCVTASGGTPVYSYTWSPTGGNASCSAPTLTVPTGGTSVYTVVVSDVNSCTVAVTGTLTSPPQATVTSAVTNVTCGSSPCTASATLTPNGGTGPFTYQWSCSGTTTPTVSNQCAGTTCNYTVTDAGTGCKYTGSVTFAPAPPTLTVSVSASALSCSSNCNAVITPTVSGGTPGYTYSWAGPGVCPTCTVQGSMCAGNYTVTVTDNLGCTKSATVAVTAPPALTVSLNATQPTCNSSCNGSILATISGGTAPYPTINWSPSVAPNPPGTLNPTGLCGTTAPGTTYTLSVTDNNGCQGSGTATLIAPPALTVTIAQTDITCNGLCNGSATTTATGGTPPYSYSWDGGAFGPSTTASGLCAGPHTIAVKDNNSCTSQTQTITINQPNPISVAVTNPQNTCGPCTGQATASASGGTAPYTYTWSPTGGNAPLADSLCIGNYTVTVGDANNCPTASATVTIAPIVVISITATSQSVSCNGACDGAASATASSGVPPYTMTWSVSPTYTVVTSCNSVVSTCSVGGLCPGTYVVGAVDQNGCVNKDSVVIGNPPLLTATVTTKNATCFGSCTGSATVTPSGGTAPYTVTWSTGATGPTINNLCPGPYTVTVLDNRGCSVIQTFTVNSNSQLSYSTSNAAPVACAGANGSISVTGLGGTAPYTFTWNPTGGGTVTTVSPSSTLSAIPAGIYSVTIMDVNGCDTTVQLTLSDPGAPTISATTTSVSCFGVCNGSATVTAVGTPTISITWQFGNNLSSPITQNNMCAGVYSVQATDGNGCNSFQNVTINGPSQITQTPVSMVNPGCSGATGSIGVTAGGGSGSGYSFSWDGGAQTTNPATGLSAGVHTLVITDGAGCTQTFTDTLKSTTQPTVTVNSVNPTCSYLINGTATATVNGGTPTYTLTWTSVTSGVISSGANDINVANLPADSYTVSVVDAVGCTTQQTFTITSPVAIAPNFTKTDNLCNAGCTGSATVAPTGGTGGYTYQWSPGGQTTPIVTNMCPNNYTVVVTDANNCTDTTTFTIVQPPALTVTATQTDVKCNGACTGSATLAISGGTPGYSISWSPVASFNPIVSNLCAGGYAAAVTDTNGCTASANITINEPSPILSTFTPKSPLCPGDCNGSIHDTTSGGVGPYTYTWSASGGGTVTTTTSTTTYTNLCAGTYVLITTDANGCVNKDSSTIVNPSQPGMTYVSTDATCGQCDGSVTITSLSGTAPVTVTWIAPAACGSNLTCNNMCAGIDTLVLTDGNGCKDTNFVAVSNPNGPQIDSVVTNVSCFGSASGSIKDSVTSGINHVTPYTFTWTPPGTVTTTSNTSTNSGLTAGVYIATVADSLGCITATSFTITQPTKIQDNGNSTNATCQGINDGSITSIASGGTPSMAGGTPTYTFTLDGTTTNTTGIFNGLAVGTHTVCIGDSLGCSVCHTYNIGGNITILSSVSSTNINCFGNCNGTATLSSINGGAAPYSINWSDPNSQTSLVATNLCAGSYTATITDTNGCKATQSVNIIQPAQLSVSAVTTDPNCGQCNGTISVTPAGGTPASTGYVYQWNTSATTSAINNVCAGVYQVNVKDSLGCQQSFQLAVSNSTAPGTSLAINSPICGNTCSGSATVTPTSGTAPFTYFWPVGGQTTPSVNGLCAGLYFVQVKDSVGCIATDSVQINPGTVLNVTPGMTNPPCNACTGVISVVVSGGGNNYSYNWLPGNVNNDTLSGLCAGIYTLITTDVASGCTDTSTFGLNNNSNGPTLTFATTNVLCNGACNGTATVTATNGTPGYIYQWTNGANTAIVNGLCSSNQPYGVLVTDANGCIQTGQITISEPNQLIASTSIVSEINCNGTCNGSINTVVSGGTPGYSYAWNPATISGSSGSNLCAGNYSVMVTDTNGCTVNIFDTLVAPPSLVITGTVTPTTCSNASDGAISTTTTGGTPTYSWQWSGGSTATTPNISNIPSGAYTVVVTDAKNCTATDTFMVNPTVTITVNAGKDTTACGISSLTLNGVVNAGTTVQWAQVPNPPGPVIGNTPTVTVNPAIGTTQYVLVGTNGACSASDTISVTSNPLPVPDAGIAMSTFATFSVTLGGNPTNPSGGTVWWSPGAGLSDSTLTNPVVTSPQISTTYTVYETNTFGCMGWDTITVTVLPTFIIPNGFSPNGDGYNDFWQIDNIQLFPDCEVEVFNRWGEPLFYSKGYNTPWNGTYGGKPVPVGTYYYLIRLHDKKFPDHYTGPLTILR